MNKKIIEEVNKLEKVGITNVEMLALVTNTSYEVVFYGNCNGQKLQSNDLVEKDLIDSMQLDQFYKSIAEVVRTDKRFDKEKMNVVKYYKDAVIDFIQEEKDCRVYSIKKDWKSSLQ